MVMYYNNAAKSSRNGDTVERSGENSAHIP